VALVRGDAVWVLKGKGLVGKYLSVNGSPIDDDLRVVEGYWSAVYVAAFLALSIVAKVLAIL